MQLQIRHLWQHNFHLTGAAISGGGRVCLESGFAKIMQERTISISKCHLGTSKTVPWARATTTSRGSAVSCRGSAPESFSSKLWEKLQEIFSFSGNHNDLFNSAQMRVLCWPVYLCIVWCNGWLAMQTLAEMTSCAHTESSSEMIKFSLQEKVCVIKHHGLLGSKNMSSAAVLPSSPSTVHFFTLFWIPVCLR